MVSATVITVSAAERFACVYTPIANTGAILTPAGDGKILSASVDDASIATVQVSNNRAYVNGVSGAVGVVTVTLTYEQNSTYTVQVPIGYTTFRFDGDTVTVYEGSSTKYEITGINAANEEYTVEAVTLDDGGAVYSNTDTYKLCVSIKKSGGTYVFDGKGNDMSIAVKKEATAPAVLLLAGVELYSSFTSPITVKKNSTSTVTITALEGHINSFSDAEFNNGDIYGAAEDGGDGTNAEYAESAVIKGKDYANITINGSGVINLNCSTKNAIKVAEYGSLTIDGAVINAVSVKHGISSDNTLTVNSGVVNVTAAEDGIRTDPSAVDATVGCSGMIYVNGGVIAVEAGYDCIQSAQDIIITDGIFNLKSGSGYTDSSFNGDTMSCKGIKASFSSDSTDSTDTSEATNTIDITGGIFNINTPDDAIHSDAYAVIEGGVFIILTSDDGVHADTSLTMGIENGTDDDLSISVNACYEGLEAGNVYFYSGTYYVISSDDGVNAAGDSTEGFNPGGTAGRPTKPGGSWGGSAGGNTGTTTTSAYAIHINGGNLYVNTNSDGMDSNGNFNMNGGSVVVWGAPSGSDGNPVDCDGSFNITGGTIFAAGSSQMSATPSTSGQGYVRSTTSISSGKTINVTYNNTVYFSTVAIKNINYIVFSCPEMTSSSGWSITTGTGGTSETREEICAAGHSYTVEFITEKAECTEAGELKFVCSVCGDAKTETLAATGHAFDSEYTVDVEATETKNGSKSRHCLCCDAVTDVTAIEYESAEKEHSYVAVVTAPTCTEDGYTTYTCSECGDYYIADEVSATGHLYETVITEPTCTETGYTTHTCTACGYSYADSVTDVTAHNYVDGVCTECGDRDPSTLMPGDVNGDGVLNARDTIYMRRYMAGLLDATQIVFANADINGDGVVNSKDSLSLKRLLI